jgi:hypothetical protein
MVNTAGRAPATFGLVIGVLWSYAVDGGITGFQP